MIDDAQTFVRVVIQAFALHDLTVYEHPQQRA
jgi:hypothetical protein